VKRISIIFATLVFFLAASAASAQETPPVPAPEQARLPAPAPPTANAGIPPEKLQRIYHIRQLEGLLTNAVKVGASSLAVRLNAEPNSLFVTSNARTRGFELDGYGVFFAVDVPTIMPSVLWSTQMLQRRMQDVMQLREALADPKTPPGMRRFVEMDLRKLERDLGLQPAPLYQQAAPPGVAVAATAENIAPVAAIPDPRDPNEIYTDAIKDKLIDAMLVYGGALRLDDSEWLTVAARSASDNLSGLDDSSSIVLRLKGADLNAYIMKKLSRDEVVKKIEIKEG
jgi:hypothetical protein